MESSSFGKPVEVEVRDSLEKAMKILKQKMSKEGILQELKRRRFYEKPSVKKKRKRKEGVLTYYYTGVTLLPEYQARAEAQAAELESMREAARWARGLRG